MISRFAEIENSYIENFSNREEKGDHIIFRDEKLPDMHAFNCVFIKENMSKDSIEGFILNCLNEVKLNEKGFLKIFFHPKVELTDSLTKSLIGMEFEIETNLYMKVDAKKAEGYRVNEACNVVIANTDNEFEAGRVLDIETSIFLGTPSEFAHRKSLRKMEVFQDPGNKLYLYLCYHENNAIGKCELHLMGDYGKIESFTVLEKYQRMGIGTTILKRAILDASELGINNIYLITGKDDTPKEMYSKLGFEVIGEEIELFWSKS